MASDDANGLASSSGPSTNSAFQQPSSNNGSTSPNRCPICLAPPTMSTEALHCRHTFCWECIAQWRLLYHRCPVCREIISCLVSGWKEQLVLVGERPQKTQTIFHLKVEMVPGEPNFIAVKYT